MTSKQSIKDAISRASVAVGGDSNLADACDVTPAAIWNARSRGQVSGKLAIKIERATNGLISRALLAPELFSDTAVSA